jgi:hypothetical protein
MSLELVNTLATFGTFVVIAATAIAAIVQLRHARSSNHIAAINKIREAMDSLDFQAAAQFVSNELPTRVQDPQFRYQWGKPLARTNEMLPLIGKVRTLGNFYENMGLLVKTGLVDRDLVLEMWGWNAVQAWEQLAPMAAIGRRKTGDMLWEHFEYVTVLGQDWLSAHPKGAYPANVRRIALKDEWLDADKQYAASLAPA